MLGMVTRLTVTSYRKPVTGLRPVNGRMKNTTPTAWYDRASPCPPFGMKVYLAYDQVWQATPAILLRDEGGTKAFSLGLTGFVYHLPLGIQADLRLLAHRRFLKNRSFLVYF